MWPALPGLVNVVSGLEVAVTWRRFYQSSFFFGYFVSGGLFLLFGTLFPPLGLSVQVNFNVDGTIVVEGVPVEEKAGSHDEKGPDSVNTKVLD
jgi:NCS1 family nucleobase:cation symporter-1